MPVRHDPPPLHFIRAFLMVAEKKSFTRAAEEIGVTQSAISQRIAQLEARLGARLLSRVGGSVVLTEAGRRFQAASKAALGMLEEAETAIRNHEDVIRISTYPSLAKLWLLPRLSRLYQAVPDCRLIVHTTDDCLVPDESDLDLVLRFTLREGLGEPLFADTEELVAVTAPTDGVGSIVPIEARPLLDDDCTRAGLKEGEQWQSWREENAKLRLQERPTILFNDASLMLEAAIRDVGIALSRRHFVSDLIASRSLSAVGRGVAARGRTVFIKRRGLSRNSVAERAAAWLQQAGKETSR